MRIVRVAISLCSSALLSACQAGGDAGTSIDDAPTSVAVAKPLPDSTGWGTHVLTVAEAPDGSIWVDHASIPEELGEKPTYRGRCWLGR